MLQFRFGLRFVNDQEGESLSRCAPRDPVTLAGKGPAFESSCRIHSLPRIERAGTGLRPLGALHHERDGRGCDLLCTTFFEIKVCLQRARWHAAETTARHV